MKELSAWVVPVAVALILLFGLIRKVPVFSEFVAGAKEGAQNSVDILPSLVGLITAVTMLRASGAMELMEQGISVLTAHLGVPREIFPMILLRPISGSGSIALLDNVLKTYGPDSLPGRIASVMAASTETTFYTIAVYFGAVRVKKTRYALPAAMVADCTCTIVSILTVHLLFQL